MTQKITIPQQNQPFRRQSSLGGNVSFRNLGGTDDNNYVVMAIVTKVYYKQGRVDFKLTNSTNHVVTETGDGTGSAPIPVDFYGYQRNGKIFGHYRPIQVGDLIAVAYLWGHKQAPIVLGVYPKNSSSYEFVAPQGASSFGDDKDEATYDYALGDQKIFPDGSLEYHSGNGKYFKTLRGKSFMLLDDSPLYEHLWVGYNDIGAFKDSDQNTINPLQEEAGDWLLVHEDNNEGSNSTDHRTRFYVNKDGTFQVVLSKSSKLDNLVILEGSKSNGFTLQQLYNVPQKGWISEKDPHKEPDIKNAQQYVKFNIGGPDHSATVEAATKDDSVEQATKLEIKDDGIYVNGKALVSSNPKYAGKTIIDDTISNSDGLNDAIKKAQDAAEQAKQAGELAKDAGVAAEAAGNDAKATGDDIKKRIIYYASISNEQDVAIPGKYIIVNTDTYIANGTIKNAAIENGAIDHAKIANEAVGSSQIEDLAVTRANIAYSAIGTAQIEDAAITDAKIGSLSADKITTGTLDADKIKVVNLTADNIKVHSISADILNIGQLSDITGDAGQIIKGHIQASDDPNSGVQIDGLDADNPNKYTPAKKAFLLSEVKKLNSAAEAAIDYGTQTHTDYSAVQTAKAAMDNGLAPLLGDMTATTEFDYNTVIKLEQDLQNAINAFHSKTNSDIMAQIGTTASGKNAIYRGAEDPVTAGKQPHENDIWLQILNDGTYNIRVWDGAQWINPGLADIKAVKNALSGLSKSYYQTEEPVGGDVHDGDTWYKLTKGSDGKYTYVAYKRESGQWVRLLDSNDVTNQTAINNLNTSLSKLPQSYYSSTQPTGKDYKDGDIWYKISTNTTNNNVVYTPFKWNPNTNTWDPMLDASSSRNYVGSAPASPLEGDFWMDNTTLKQYQNGVWKTIPTQGPQGIPGKPGADGKTYYTWIKYATDSKGSDMRDSPAGMSYIGIAYNKESPNESSTPTDYTWSQMKGDQGISGKDGVGIKSTIITYQLSSSGTTTPTGTWSTTVPTLVKGQYLWTRTTLVYTDNTTKDVYTVSYVAKDGNNGTDGVAGKDGVGIKSTTITYQESTSGTTAPTGTWVANPPSVAGGNYLWTRTVWSYTDGTSETGYSVAKAGEKGADGKDGDPGIPGAPGKDGQTTYFHIAYANSADGSVGFTDTPGDNSYDYFGTYTDYNLLGSKDPTKYKWVKMFDSSKKRNFTTTPTTPYDVGDTWTKSGATYFCTNARDSGAFDDNDWTMQQLTIHSLDSNVQTDLNNNVKTTGNYKGVTLNDNGLTATAGSTTVAMNSNDGFLINNNGEQVFHVDTNGSLNMQGNITAGNITGVTLQGQDLTLEGSLKLTADTSGIVSNDGDVVFSKDGISVASGNTTVNINGGNPLRIQNNNNDIFKVDNDGSLTISGNLAAGDSPNSTISGVDFTGKSLTLSGSMKVNGQISFANGNGVLDENGLSLQAVKEGNILSISDQYGKQTTYITDDGTLVADGGKFSGEVTATSLTLDNSEKAHIDVAGTFHVDAKGNVTANSFTSNNVNITGGVLDAGGVNITNINADNITAGMLSGQHLEINGDTYIHGELNVPTVKLNGKNGSIDLSGDGIHIGGPDGDIKLDSGGIDITKNGQGLSISGDYIQVVTDSNGQKEVTGLIGSNFNLKNKNQNGLALLVTPQQELGRPYGGDLLTIGELQKNGEVTSAVTFDATNITGDGAGFHWTAPHYLHGPAQAIHITETQDNLTLLPLKMPHSSQESYYQPALTITHGIDGNGNYVHGDSGVEFLWDSIKPYGSVDMTDARLWVYGVDHGIKNVWVSWSNWDGGEKYPALVNDIGYWGGIAFPKSGRVTLFDADGRYYTPDRNTGIGAYDNYMSKNNNWH